MRRAATFAALVAFALGGAVSSPLGRAVLGKQADAQQGNAAPTQQITGTVIRVADGDTVTMRGQQGDKIRVRLLGIDAPEIAHGKGETDQCGGPQAAAALRDFALREQAVLIIDPNADSQDRYGRRLGYLSVHGSDAAEHLLRDGLVGVWRPKGAPEPTRWSSYRQLAQQAQKAGTGSWKICGELGRL